MKLHFLSFFEEGWIDSSLKNELRRFREFMRGINTQFWNANDFDQLEDWGLARNWAVTLMQNLKMKRNGWNSEGTTIIYTGD